MVSVFANNFRILLNEEIRRWGKDWKIVQKTRINEDDLRIEVISGNKMIVEKPKGTYHG